MNGLKDAYIKSLEKQVKLLTERLELYQRSYPPIIFKRHENSNVVQIDEAESIQDNEEVEG